MINIYKKLEDIWFMINKKVRFLLVGGFNTAFAYGLFCLLFEVFGLSYTNSVLIQYFIGINLSIFTMNHYVFKSKNAYIKTLQKGFITYISLLGLNYIYIYIIETYTNIYPLIAQLIYILISIPLNYIVFEKFTYAKKREKK